MIENKRINGAELVRKFVNREQALVGKIFLAPYVGGGKVRLQIDQLIYDVRIEDAPTGWGLFQLMEPGVANFAGSATPSLRDKYLSLLPRFRLVAVDEWKGCWWAVAALSSGARFSVDGAVPLHLCERLSRFETVYARFDGAQFWFDRLDRRRDPVIARKLREALAQNVPPEQVRCKGAIPGERLAYRMLWLDKQSAEGTLANSDISAFGLDDRTRVAEALRHADARLDSFWYHNGAERATVRFVHDGATHVVQVRTGDLTAVSAGVCLSGREADFDLTSIVGVLKQFRDSGRDAEQFQYLP